MQIFSPSTPGNLSSSKTSVIFPPIKLRNLLASFNAQSDPGVVFNQFTCHFYFMLYCFIGFSWSMLPLFVPLRSVQSQRPLDVVNRSAQSRCPPDILWSSLRYGRCKADIHRMSCTLVFALIRVRKH